VGEELGAEEAFHEHVQFLKDSVKKQRDEQSLGRTIRGF
jgi:hypothetical protein